MARSVSHPKAVALVPPQVRWSGRRLALTLGLVALLGWLALRLGDAPRLLSAALGIWTRPELLAAFLSTYTAAFVLRAWAWRLLLSPSPGTPRLFVILQIALFANHVFPTKAGEVIRAGLLARRGVSLGAAAGSTMLARLLDVAALCLITLVLGLYAGGHLTTLLGLFALPLAMVGAGALGCLLLAAGKLAPLWALLPRRIARIAQEAQAALAAVSALRVLIAFTVVVVSWLLEAGALWSVAQAAGVPLSLAVAAAATAFTIAFQGLQVTPGGLGLYEASLTGVLALYGLDPATGLALAVATHALKFAYAYLVGIPCLIAEGLDSLGLPSPIPSRADGSHTRVGEGARRGGALAWQVAWAAALPPGVRDAVRMAFLRLDPGLVLAVLVTLVIPPAAWASATVWLAFLAGTLATAPLMVLGRCHHLPRRLTPLLLVVPLLFLAVFGLPAPAAGLTVLALAGGLAVWRRLVQPVGILWPGLLAQSIAAGGQHPLAVAGFGLAALSGVVLARQWWLAHHPLPLPGPPSPGSILAVLVPVHNEAATIAAVVAGVPRAALRGLGVEPCIIVVDDGSDDGSAASAHTAGADLVIRHPRRRGLGAAVRTGLAAARTMGAGVAVYLDGDGEYDSGDIPAVAAPVLRGEADYVLGIRFPGAARRMRPSRRWGNLAFTALLSLLTGRRLRDGQTGLRAFSARALAQAEIVHDYNYAQVLTLDLLRKGMRLAHVPISYRTRQHGTSFIRYREYLRRVVPAMVREVLSP
ncbi:MAG: flippase-like domain-containing protein [Chloroflexi bacterium]|nr:flippase-like domain-containing protein [Chloroflexota bacterium]